MLTPQAIKDQEFQIKFRGYDAIEVKAYLELLAEDFFELTEQNRLHGEEIESLKTELEFLQREKDNVAAEMRLGQENSESIQAQIDQGYKHKDQEISELKTELEKARASAQALELENRTLQNSVNGMQSNLTGGAGESLSGQAEIEKLRAKNELLEEQNRELKKEGLDFKTTIVAAQKFADSLRQTSEEEALRIKQSSEEEAARIMEIAQAEVQKFRAEANAELVKLPKEIEKLQRQKNNVREDLRTTLHSYLEALELTFEKDSTVKDDDLSELFQTISLPDKDSNEPEGVGKLDMDLS